ncbi:hypothetical protein Hanom_Chr12g01072191 [Helianthus anomalus]
MEVSEDLLLDGENQDIEDDIVDIEHDVPVIVADPVLNQTFLTFHIFPPLFIKPTNTN